MKRIDISIACSRLHTNMAADMRASSWIVVVTSIIKLNNSEGNIKTKKQITIAKSVIFILLWADSRLWLAKLWVTVLLRRGVHDILSDLMRLMLQYPNTQNGRINPVIAQVYRKPESKWKSRCYFIGEDIRWHFPHISSMEDIWIP